MLGLGFTSWARAVQTQQAGDGAEHTPRPAAPGLRHWEGMVWLPGPRRHGGAGLGRAGSWELLGNMEGSVPMSSSPQAAPSTARSCEGNPKGEGKGSPLCHRSP